MRLRFVIIDGKTIPWKEILKLRKAQKDTLKQGQPVLFELHTDIRPVAQATASARFQEPTLFDGA